MGPLCKHRLKALVKLSIFKMPFSKSCLSKLNIMTPILSEHMESGGKNGMNTLYRTLITGLGVFPMGKTKPVKKNCKGVLKQ